MATTNTNTDNQNILSTDIYDISNFLDQIRKDNITNISDTSAMVGIFGYMNEMFSQTLQNSLVVISENTNETIPTRAKFTKNIINHAMNLGITDICAKPAVMTMMIYMPISYIESNFTEINKTTGKAKFILSKDCPIKVGTHEFHLDYDIIFTRIKNPQGKYIYTAIYDLFEPGTTNIKQHNPISDITNPYITTLVQCTLNNINYLAFSARLHQVTLYTDEKNILTSTPIENKAVTFTFNDQLASFDVDVIENNKITHLTPIYSGLIDYTIQDGYWCNYSYINDNTIRILFSQDSYVPSVNAIVRINIKTSEGSNGNFTFNGTFKTNLISEKYNNYNGMYIYVTPLLGGVSNAGKDKKSIKDLKKIIPREASSRGSIINTTDLHNFFNAINNDECRLYFKKKKDNPFERMYYGYILMRKNGYVYPTNTLNAKINQDNFKGFAGNNNLVISPGTKFYYYNHGDNEDNDFATLEPPLYVENLNIDDYPYPMTINENGNMVRVFEYTTPFLISIDDDLITSYLLTIMNENKTFSFESINTDSDIQFIATNMLWKRNYICDDISENRIYDYKYTMDILMMQNAEYKYTKLVSYHMEDDKVIFDDVRVKVFMVLYSDETENNPYRYIEANLILYDKNLYTFRFTLNTDDLMDLNNRINITGIYNCKPEEFQHKINLNNSHGYMNKNTYAKIFILADFGTKPGDIVNNKVVTEDTAEVILYGEDNIGNRSDFERIIPTRNDIIESFLKNDIYLEEENGNQLNIINIMKSNPDYISKVKEYNNNEQETELMILRYIRNNINSDFVQNILLNDANVLKVIDSYNYEDLSRYTLCNVLSVNNGIDFYHDYSNIMKSTVKVKQIQKTDNDGNLVYKEIIRTDALGNNYTEYKPIYLVNDNGSYHYNYEVKRIPLLKYDYLNTESLMQEFIFDLEERRKYINECIYVLEDTFDLDLKFFNTFGPSKMFYYDIPSSQQYKASVAIKDLKVLNSTVDEDDENNIVGWLHYGTEIDIIKTKGQWGYISYPYEGWIKLADTIKIINYIDNVAINMKFSLEAETSADKYIGNNIISDIKEYIEDINSINELHIPNIITFITNNYREQLVYFEFLDVNGYGASCQHLYLDEKVSADICPEFLNIETLTDGSERPNITIAIY